MNKKLILGLGIGLITLVLVGVILVLIFGIGGNPKDKNDPTSYIYSEGDIVKIPIEVTKNPGMSVAEILVNYDASVLDYVDCEDGLFTYNTIIAEDGTATCLLMTHITADKDITKTGTAATLVFKVKKGAKAGEYLFSVDEKSSEYVNLSEKFVTPEVSVTNKITIK